ncbi:asparagine synthase-related protein [Sphingomicrobium arenosum]|uniref:asparagine synthase-related protein n=1 Tax=Sphingomicrobium arenosum TaxID=2233861 RepID=UPI0022410247|nr:asparagine synthase-related protein [Sphingomicrobium arenosum]
MQLSGTSSSPLFPRRLEPWTERGRDTVSPPPFATGDDVRLWLDALRPPSAEQASDIARRLARLDWTAFDGLRGGFVGILQTPTRTLLFRDALGRKALHYRLDGEAVDLDRDALPLARIGGTPRLDEQWLARYFLTLPEEGPRSPFDGVTRVEPGHVVVIEHGRARHETWWTPSFEPLDIGFEEARDTAATLLDEAIGGSDCDALLLSSGIDSNVILSRLAHLGRTPRAITGSPSAHADPSAVQLVDEYPLAHAGLRSVGGSEHHRLRAAPSGLRDALNWGYAAYQRPMYNPSNLGWVDGCQALASSLGMTRIFDGLQGNYTLGHNGMRPTIALAAARRWGDWARAIAANGGRDIRASLLAAPPDWLARLLARPSARRHVRDLFANPRSARIKAAMAPEIALGVRQDYPGDGLAFPERRLRDYIAQVDPAGRYRAAERRNGIELVDPYAERELVEFSLRLPEAIFRHDGVPRGLQRALLDPRLPPDIRDPRMTAIQGGDWRAAALRDAGLMKRILDRLEDGHRGAELFDVRAMRRALDNWPASGWDDEDQVVRYRIHLGRAMSAAAFAQWVADGAP